MFCSLWEIETGQKYLMTKSHDIFSGLGSEAGISNAKIENKSKDIESLNNPPPEKEVVKEEEVESVFNVDKIDAKNENNINNTNNEGAIDIETVTIINNNDFILHDQF